jgi:2-dehydro-3-deoxyphosphogluconate aldolase/(4S)-4-hydroxy-2-oxoglutarate aldolase
MTALETIRGQGVVAIVRSKSADAAAAAVDVLVNAGLRAVEVSLVTPGALGVVRSAAATAPEGVAIGVGTVLRESDVEAAVEAGASFVVCPAFDRGVVRAALRAGIDVLPGVATPTEAIAATDAGASAVKLFPASLWTPTILGEVRAALPWLETVPTGGVTPTTAADWIRAGASAVGIGSALTRAPSPQLVVSELLEAIAEARTISGR